MREDVIFLTVDQLLAIHRRMIDEFGGTDELRDRGLLESAAAMPAARFGGQFLHEGIAAMTAAYLFHLCRNYPFVDGNEQTTLAAAETFLLLNNKNLAATNDELEHLTLGVANNTVSKEETTVFFGNHVTDAPPPSNDE